MNNTITCFLPAGNREETISTINELRNSNLVSNIYLLGKADYKIDKVEFLNSESLLSGEAIHEITAKSSTDFTLIYTKTSALKLGQFALNRFTKVASDTQASLTYSDSKIIKNDKIENHPVIDYQEGSLRDDFDFGSLLFINTKALKSAISSVDKNNKYAGLYSLRLALSEQADFSSNS